MSKYTTNDCKNELVKLFPDSSKNEWKRTKKYKNEDKKWIRDFENANNGISVSLLENETGLEIYKKETQFYFTIYKHDINDSEWNLELSHKDNESGEREEDEECVREFLENIFKNEEVEEIDSPLFSCSDQQALYVFNTLSKNGAEFCESYVDKNNYIVFDKSAQQISDQKNVKNNISLSDDIRRKLGFR